MFLSMKYWVFAEKYLHLHCVYDLNLMHYDILE